MINITPFFEKYPEAIDSKAVPKETIDKYSKIFPESIIEIWEKHGLGGYENGLFWTINPDDYQKYVDKWISKNQYDDYIPILRTAFGDILTICNFDKSDIDFEFVRFVAINIRYSKLSYITIGISNLINNYLIDPGTLLGPTEIEAEFFGYGIFDLGELKRTQCYGFEPILVLGGEEIEENIRIFDLNHHLEILTSALKDPLKG